LDEEGLLTLADATPHAYKLRGSFQAFDDGHEAWGPMALAGGRLILRDLTRMSCLDVSEN
jgi:outer membrane protein assembly factor BamB